VYIRIIHVSATFVNYIDTVILFRGTIKPYIASFPGLQSPYAVEGLVKLVRRMMSGRRWIDVG